MKPEEKIKQGPERWAKVYEYRAEICLFVFLITTLLATAVDAALPETEEHPVPSVFVGFAWGLLSAILCGVAYLGWWLWVGLTNKDI